MQYVWPCLRNLFNPRAISWVYSGYSQLRCTTHPFKLVSAESSLKNRHLYIVWIPGSGQRIVGSYAFTILMLLLHTVLNGSIMCFWSENILFAILRLILSKGHYCALSSTIGQLDHFEGPAFIFGGKVMINPLSTIIRETLHLITRTPITT